MRIGEARTTTNTKTLARGLLLALLVLTCWSYRSAWSAPYVYEDANAVAHGPIAVNRTRWVSLLSHRLVYTAFGAAPRPAHLVNLALHLTNGVLVYSVAALIVAPFAAVVAAGIFLVHPIQTEAVLYVASRSELLACLFALLAWRVHLASDRWPATAATGLLVTLAVCAKESAVVIVPILLLYDWSFRQRWSVARGVLLALPIAAVSSSVFRFDYLSVSDLSPLAYAATQAAALVRYLALVVLPIGQSVDHDVDVVPWLWRYAALYGVAALAILTTLVGLAIKDGDVRGRITRLTDDAPRVRIAAFGIAWLLIALAPRFVMRTPELLNEHQLYVPLIGVSLGLASLVTPSPRSCPYAS